MKGELKVGSVVVSCAGHDRGNRFMVIETVGDAFVLIADGKHRTLTAPKLKKMRHIKPTGDELPLVAQKLTEKGTLTDCELYRAISQTQK